MWKFILKWLWAKADIFWLCFFKYKQITQINVWSCRYTTVDTVNYTFPLILFILSMNVYVVLNIYAYILFMLYTIILYIFFKWHTYQESWIKVFLYKNTCSNYWWLVDTYLMLFFVYIKIFHHTSYSVYEGGKKKKYLKLLATKKLFWVKSLVLWLKYYTEKR